MNARNKSGSGKAAAAVSRRRGQAISVTRGGFARSVAGKEKDKMMRVLITGSAAAMPAPSAQVRHVAQRRPARSPSRLGARGIFYQDFGTRGGQACAFLRRLLEQDQALSKKERVEQNRASPRPLGREPHFP